MSVTKTILFPPSFIESEMPIPLQRWLQSVQNLLPLNVCDTAGGSIVTALPPAGVNQATITTGASNQNQEIIYIKSTADANTVTITGGISGNVVLSTQWDVARFKSDGTNWYPVCCGSGASSSLLIKVNGVEASSQTILDLTGSGVSDGGSGVVDFSGGGAPIYDYEGTPPRSVDNHIVVVGGELENGEITINFSGAAEFPTVGGYRAFPAYHSNGGGTYGILVVTSTTSNSVTVNSLLADGSINTADQNIIYVLLVGIYSNPS